MNEKYLVINCGSSSLKFQLFGMPQQEVIAKGTVERIGTDQSSWKIEGANKKIVNSKPLTNHVEAVKVVLEELLQNGLLKDINEIKGIGHRILHGGKKYKDSAIITDEVLQDIIDLTPLGPLHIPGQVAGIKCMMEIFKGIPQIAVFDTAFHQTMPKKNYMYPVPREYYEKYGVRRYGFHGTSVKYITEFMQKKLGKKELNLIVCHIGSGASITAVKYGKSYNTTMGLTPLDGLMMGTRSGSIDPSVVEYVSRVSGKTPAEVNNELNNKSGLYGIAGMNDYRDIEKAAFEGNEAAKDALDMFVASVVKYICQYYTELDCRIDGIVFTAGIGENACNFRKLVINELSETIGAKLDEEANGLIAGFKEINEGMISKPNAKTKVYVVPTNEEKMIMLDTYRLVKGIKKETDDFISFEELDKKHNEAKKRYSTVLMAFYISQYGELYHQILMEKGNPEEVHMEEIFSEMLTRDEELYAKFYEDYNDLGHSGIEKIVTSRLTENKQKTYTR